MFVLTQQKLAMYLPVDRARHICCVVHEGQTRGNGEPYHLHPMRVSAGLFTDEEKIVAYLHDVVEDTFVTLDDLRQWGFSSEIVEAMDAVTHRDGEYGESYLDYILRAKANLISKKVKLADLQDNLSDLNPKKKSDRRLRDKYLLARYILENM